MSLFVREQRSDRGGPDQQLPAHCRRLYCTFQDINQAGAKMDLNKLR